MLLKIFKRLIFGFIIFPIMLTYYTLGFIPLSIILAILWLLTGENKFDVNPTTLLDKAIPPKLFEIFTKYFGDAL